MKKRSIRRTTLAALMTSAMTVSIVPAAGAAPLSVAPSLPKTSELRSTTTSSMKSVSRKLLRNVASSKKDCPHLNA